MNHLSISRKLNFQFFIFAILLIITGSIIFGSIKSFAESDKDSQNQSSTSVLSKQASENTDDRSGKSSPIGWITVDENEFNHIQNLYQIKRGLDLEIAETRRGLSIVKLNEQQILELSRNMHGEFHKCAGFIWH